jgi:transposase
MRIIIGCDFHPGYQVIAMMDMETKELIEKTLSHENLEQVRALNQGVQRKRKLWSVAGRKQLQALPLLPWAARRREELLQLLDQLETSLGELDREVAKEANTRPTVRRLMTHPGVGPVTALAFVLTLGPPSRFARGKQVGSYFGLIPSEASSGGRQRLGRISKQGNSFMRGLLVEAAQSAVRHEPDLRRAYQRLAHRKCRALAKVAMARKLAVRLYWMLRGEMDYAQLIQGSCAGEPGSSCGRG